MPSIGTCHQCYLGRAAAPPWPLVRPRPPPPYQSRRSFSSSSPSIFPSLSPAALSHLTNLSQQILSGHRPSISRAITLLESTRPDHRQQANHLLQLLSTSSPSRPARRDIRIGISGAPGVGKSTFIEKLGQWIVDGSVQPHQHSNAAFSSETVDLHGDTSSPTTRSRPTSTTGDQLAILTIDPSSHLTGGSILGDRTRMPYLSSHPSVYIRPSPSKLSLGGTHPSTYDSLLLLTHSPFNVQLIETVGVGQSEVAVRHMVDCMLLIVGPGGGDELQGMKKGIMELSDVVVVNKADGGLLGSARHTYSDYRHAVQLMGRAGGWVPEVMMVSSVEESGAGVGRVWETVKRFDEWLGVDGKRRKRGEQERRVMMEQIPQVMWGLLMASDRGRRIVDTIQERVARGELNVRVGAQEVVEQMMQGWISDHNR